jgi:RecB family exonuclease
MKSAATMLERWRTDARRFMRRWKNRKKPIELSFSRMQTYFRCPWLYHLVYEQGWRSAPKGNMALGLTLHRTLADYLSNANTERSLARLIEIYDQMWVNEGYASTQDTLDSYDSGRKMLEKYFETDLKRRTSVVATEATFKLNVNNVELWGTVDRIDRSPDGFYEIVEYKTQADSWSADRMDNDLQLTLYEWGVREGLGYSPLRLKYYFFSTGEYVDAKRSAEQAMDASTLVHQTARRMRSEDFEPNHAHCARCEFNNRCTRKI